MARIPNNELDRLKREVSLVRLVESSGIELKKCSAQDYCRTFSQIIHHTIRLKPGWFSRFWS